MPIMLLEGYTSFSKLWKQVKKDFATSPLAISKFVIAAIHPLQSNQSPNALKYVISMWSPSNIIRNLWMPYSSGHYHLNTLGNDIQWLIQRNNNRLIFVQVIGSFPNHIHQMVDHCS